jgi:serine/threonine-protein kinase HipA
MTNAVSVFLWPEVPVGTLWFQSRNGRESASFEYAHAWIKQPERFALEPGLVLGGGTFHIQSRLFGAFGDSAPDRWGRTLMRRREEHRARTAGETPRTLTELDYLLGIYDEARQGALRFREKAEGPFLAPPEKSAIPPLLALPKLLSASERFLESRENEEDLRLLLAPGSSLGGARPKASVYDAGGVLAIAKFPRKDDEFSSTLWEALALMLAERAGIQTPLWHIERILNKPVLILKRFDRQKQNRIPFLSAMGMLSAKDNEQHSYLEIAYAITQDGANPERDLEELWRRLVFNILISNTDDHLRNHGFLYEPRLGWRLSPAYDMNPVPHGIGPLLLSLSIDFISLEASLEAALSVIEEFRLKKEKALSIIEEVKKAVSGWQSAARLLGIRREEIERMASAFM